MIETLISQLTVVEKVSLVAGADVWTTVAIDRLGIGSVKVSDGPNGVRGDSTTGAKAVCLPAPISLAASFDAGLVNEVGGLLGRELERKGAHILLAPTLNVARHPLGGRNFESFGEDPQLIAQLGAAYIGGVQAEGVGACAKHFVANDVEWERLSVSSQIPEGVLREVYLLPFEAAVEAGVWAVMTAYPRLNGTHCTENSWLLQTVLRQDWGFDGLVVSDWGAVHDQAATILAGNDLEMPRPPREWIVDLAAAAEADPSLASALDERVRSVLSLVQRAGRLDAGPLQPEQSVDLAEDRALARRAASSGMVLLRNSGPTPVLPLGPEIQSLAVIGPNATPGIIQGGGSAKLPAHHTSSPLEALTSEVSSIAYHPGVLTERYLPPVGGWVGAGTDPVRIETYTSDDLSGEVVTNTEAKGIRYFLNGPLEGMPDPWVWSQRFTGHLMIDSPGTYRFGITQTGQARVLIDGKLVVDNWTDTTPGNAFFNQASAEKTGEVWLEAGEIEVVVEWYRGDIEDVSGITLGWRPPVDEDSMLDEAVAGASKADAAVVIVGLNSDWESEGHDRASFALPGRQVELINRVAAANPRTIVVINAGSAVDMPWLDDVPATVMAWYPGQEFGDALADVLFGRADPGGRMPITVPFTVDDAPTAGCVPGYDGELNYAEGQLVGHRWYDKHGIEPRVPFGHGLSYAGFEFGAVSVSELMASVTVTNVAGRSGTCVVQAYLAPPDPDPTRPDQALVGFVSQQLEPGAQATISIAILERAFCEFVDGGWQEITGTHVVSIGTSSRELIGTAKITR